MATTTFEKESVNAVGGQLFVANSAALSGSNVASTEVSMSLVNVTGFTKGEILLIKKVGNTGFNTEYVQVVSSSRNNAGGDDDPDGLAGELFLKRGYGYYTRSTNVFYGDTSIIQYYNTAAGTDPPSGTTIAGANNSDIDTDFLPFGSSFAAGNVSGLNMVGSHVHSGSFYINISVNVNARTDDTNSFFAIGLYDGSDSDAFIAAEKFWEYADGTGNIEKDIYIPSSQVTGSTVRAAVLAFNRVADSAKRNVLQKFTASLDYGSIGSVQLGDSGSVGDPIGGPQDYTDGQVVVSTGRYISGTGNNTVGTGYIRLNANPKNSATPYMDIVERTGSGIYDVELKARLGDLSGVAGTRNVPEGFNGFGLMSEVAFLSGSNIKLEAPTFLLGDLNQNFVSGSNGNMEISSSNFHLKADGSLIVSGSTTTEVNISTPKFFLGSNTQFVSGSDSKLEISSSNFHLSSSGDVTMAGTVTATAGAIGGTNGFTITGSKFFNENNSKFIGLVEQSAAHADVGSVSAFYAGASANTGEDASISFGSDGKIRGTGVYVRNSVEFLIGAETIFGDGRDGDIRIQSFVNSIQVWTEGDTYSAGYTLSGTGTVTSERYGDVIFEKLVAGDDDTITLKRDLYARLLILDVSQDTLKIDTNGFRIFASEGIFVYSDSNDTNNVAIFKNNGADGSNGGNGDNGGVNNSSNSITGPAGPAGNAAGGADPCPNGTLVSPGAGASGGRGGGGGGFVGANTDFVNSPGAGGAGTNPQDGLGNDNPMISNFTGRQGGDGGGGGDSMLGSGGVGAAGAGAAGSLVQAGIQWFSTPADSIVKFRAEYGTNDYPARLTTMPNNSAGGGGGGGRGGFAGQQNQAVAGGAGGGGGGAGSSGGPICIVAKVIDWWREQVSHPGIYTGNQSNTGNHGFMKITSQGGDGGNGGNGGNGGAITGGAVDVVGGGGGSGGGGAGGNGGTCLLVTSNLTNTVSNPLGTLTTGHTITDPDDSDNKLTYDTFQSTTNAGGFIIGMQSIGGTGGTKGTPGSKGTTNQTAEDGSPGADGADGKEGPCPVIII